eukprot:279786_1
MNANLMVILLYTSYAFAALSVTSTILVLIGCLYLYKTADDSMKYVLKIIFFVAISDMIYAISKLMGTHDSETSLCLTQSLLNQTGSFASVLWNVVISASMHHCIRRNITIDKLNPYFAIYCCLPILLLVVISLCLPFSTQSHGPSGEQSHCWFRGDELWDFIWRKSMFYVPLFITITYMFAVSIYVHCKVWKIINAHHNDNESVRSIKLLFGYPIILIICFGPATIRRIYDWITHPHSNTPLSLIISHALFGALLGFFHAVLFAWSIWKTNKITSQQHESNTNEQQPLSVNESNDSGKYTLMVTKRVCRDILILS